MDILHAIDPAWRPIIYVIAAALAIPGTLLWVRAEKNGAMRIGLSLVFAFTGIAFCAFVRDLFLQVIFASQAAAAIGCLIYFAIRGAQPRR
jgi:hypothetical protein